LVPETWYSPAERSIRICPFAGNGRSSESDKRGFWAVCEAGTATRAVANSAAAARVRIWQSPDVTTLPWANRVQMRFQN
jgi:hypothetical protein